MKGTLDIRLYGIIGPADARGRALPDLVGAAVAGGATLIQLRDKHGATRDLIAQARALVKALAGTGVPLLVNDRVDVALAAGAQGVHLGNDDMSPDDARAILGPDAVIGLTVKTPGQALAAGKHPIDYACIGGVFATTSKDNPDPPVGLAGLAAMASSIRAARPDLPVGAIAGIGAANAAQVIGAGADGIAVISALFSPPDVRAEAAMLRRIVDDALAARGASWGKSG